MHPIRFRLTYTVLLPSPHEEVSEFANEALAREMYEFRKNHPTMYANVRLVAAARGR